jgi:hypothetical protein
MTLSIHTSSYHSILSIYSFIYGLVKTVSSCCRKSCNYHKARLITIQYVPIMTPNPMDAPNRAKKSSLVRYDVDDEDDKRWWWLW